MKYTRHFLLVFCFICFACAVLRGQVINSFNLNADNGLPSNHVYGMITDRYGYLWICTDKGVVKYNGCECKLFDMSNGLPTDDVWQLVEDRKGRIWLGAISDEIGYIENDKYHKVNLGEVKGTIFPEYLNPYNDGVIFTSRHVSGGKMPVVCIVQKDSVYRYNIDEDVFNVKDKLWNIPSVYCNSSGGVYVLYKERIYSIDNLSAICEGKNKPVVTLLKNFDKGFLRDMSFGHICVIGDNILVFSSEKNTRKIKRMNLRSLEVDSIDIRDHGVDESVWFLNYEGSPKSKENIVYVYTKNYILKYFMSNEVRFSQKYELDKLVKNRTPKMQFVSCIDGAFGKKCIATNANGVFMNLEVGNEQFAKSSIDLDGYTQVGVVADSVLFWWSANDRKLLKTIGASGAGSYELPNVRNVYKVLRHNKDTLLLLGNDNYFLKEGTSKVYWIPRGILGTNVLDFIPQSQERAFVLSKLAIYNVGSRYGYDSVNRSFIDMDRYEGAEYDSVRKRIWVYNHKKILLIDPAKENGACKQQLADLKFNNIEKICVDNRFGTVVIKTTNAIFLYDNESHEKRQVLERFNLNYSDVAVYKDKLVVSGNFGMLYCKLLGKCRLSDPVVLYNAKNILYKKADGLGVANGVVLLNTTDGTYSVKLSADSEYSLPSGNQLGFLSFRLLGVYAGKTFEVSSIDTLETDQRDNKLLFDVINPSAVGKVSYYYKVANETIWHKLNSNELTIPLSFLPDRYYHIQLYAGDDGARTAIHDIVVHIVPYWWQTKRARLLIRVGAVVLGLLIIVLVVVITRRQVMKAAARKQLQMEMELKSIYSQINPHFIFNSLNSALLLVSKNKMDEAYVHISRFSKLLRSYLRSSRNKYVLIGEEVANLKNYIELQQTRFKSRFEYVVEVDEAIDVERTRIPSLLIQPFVENAINHGILPMEGHGELLVRFVMDALENRIICIIEDNGIGRERSRLNYADSEQVKDSYGDLMIKDLVNIFNKYEKINIAISYYDKQLPATGTVVTIAIKNPQYEP